MRFIGITGGVGAGKSAILAYLAEKPNTRVMLADEIAHKLMEPGTDCYKQIVERFQDEDIFQENGPFHRGKLATVIFSNEEKREAMNAIVHPAVKDYVQRVFQQEKQKGQLELLVLEAALLIEEDYGAICDELWYIYTSEENRRARLKASRGYSDEKIDSIFNSQLSEAQFRAGTQVTIDNNGDLEETFRQIENALRREANE
ncbi:MAG: dephospho-CoA kinase [Lachnospiraceae bacterium]|nr:dephospho-CoA kinase [Lachnospiraceae bacterium]